MLTLKKEKAKSGRSIIHTLACLSVFVYIVSAVAFEMTPETAYISTLAIYLVFAVGMIFLLQRNNGIIVNEYLPLALFFCMFVYLRNVAENASRSMGMQIAYWTLTCSILCLLVCWMTAKYTDILTFAMFAYILGAVILSVRIVIAYGGISEIIEDASSLGENRIGGLLGNENAIGLFLANGILSSLLFLIKDNRKLVRILMLFSMLLLTTMLLLTGSRKSLAFVLLGILFILYFNYRKANIGKKLFILLIVVAGCILLYNVITTQEMFSTINERLKLLFEGVFGEGSSYETDQMRKIMISEGLEAFYENPIFGNGTGYSYSLFGTYSHNNFVELLMNYGIVGFVAYYAIYLCLLFKLWPLVKSRNLYAIYFFVYTSVQLLLGIGWVNYYERSVQIVTALAFGYIFTVKKQQKNRN